MKKSTSFLTVMFCFVFSLNATILIVDKNPTAPVGSYSTPSDAITAANTGDTIYITPASTGYGNFSVSKQLVIMGNGHHPNPYNDYPWISEVGTITLSHANASGTTIIGLLAARIYTYMQNVTNITIVQNKITNDVSASTNCSNWMINNNLFIFYKSYGANDQIIINYNSHWYIENNIFSGRSNYGNYSFIQNSSSHDVVISNNLFIGDSLTVNYQVFSTVSNAIVINNIFHYKAPSGCTYCNMSGNLTYKTTQNTIPYGNNFGANNIINQDPQFVNAPQQAHNYSNDYDYHLSPGSPGINAGTDGNNIGIYGGTYPYTDIVPIPKVISVLVLNPKLPLNDTLQVRIKAKNY